MDGTDRPASGNVCTARRGSAPRERTMIYSILMAALLWVQVPQWSDDWSKCAVDVPDVNCHWYVVAPDSTFGEGFSWANAPWFSAEGLLDVGELHDTMKTIQQTEE